MGLPVEEGVRQVIGQGIRIMKEQISRPEDVHRSIHECRRNSKRIRAILKLIRDGIGYSNYFRENRFFRDLSRRMSGARDDIVLLQGMESFELQKPGIFGDEGFSAVKGFLSARAAERTSDFLTRQGGFKKMLKELEEAEERIGGYCRLENDFSAMKTGIRRIYRQGYKYSAGNRIGGSAEGFHEYRKLTKYLLYQMELVSPVFPGVMNAYTGVLDRHAELLGDTRDLDRLELFLSELPEGLHQPKAMLELQELIRQRRGKWLNKILGKSPLLFAEKPKQFIRRLESYWDITHQNN